MRACGRLAKRNQKTEPARTSHSMPRQAHRSASNSVPVQHSSLEPPVSAQRHLRSENLIPAFAEWAHRAFRSHPVRSRTGTSPAPLPYSNPAFRSDRLGNNPHARARTEFPKLYPPWGPSVPAADAWCSACVCGWWLCGKKSSSRLTSLRCSLDRRQQRHHWPPPRSQSRWMQQWLTVSRIALLIALDSGLLSPAKAVPPLALNYRLALSLSTRAATRDAYKAMENTKRRLVRRPTVASNQSAADYPARRRSALPADFDGCRCRLGSLTSSSCPNADQVAAASRDAPRHRRASLSR